MTNLAFIPARGNSKSIPFKNIKELHGKPLIYWVLQAASSSPIIDKVVVATENERIKQTVLSFKMPKVEVYDRDPNSALDASPTIDVVLEYLGKYPMEKDDLFFLLQATSPLTTSEDILGIYEKLKTEGAQTALTCVRQKRFYWSNGGKPLNYDYKKRPRRQDFEGIFMENGAIYLTYVDALLREKCLLSEPVCVFEMPSHTDVELDEPHDWIVVENLIKRYK